MAKYTKVQRNKRNKLSKRRSRSVQYGGQDGQSEMRPRLGLSGKPAIPHKPIGLVPGARARAVVAPGARGVTSNTIIHPIGPPPPPPIRTAAFPNSFPTRPPPQVYTPTDIAKFAASAKVAAPAPKKKTAAPKKKTTTTAATMHAYEYPSIDANTTPLRIRRSNPFAEPADSKWNLINYKKNAHTDPQSSFMPASSRNMPASSRNMPASSRNMQASHGPASHGPASHGPASRTTRMAFPEENAQSSFHLPPGEEYTNL